LCVLSQYDSMTLGTKNEILAYIKHESLAVEFMVYFFLSYVLY